MKSFTHRNARSVKEAVALLTQYKGKAKPIAGGTDLLGALKEQSLPDYPETVINLKTIPGLRYIKDDEGGLLRIGALTSLAEIGASPTVKEHYRILSDAALSVATPQVRNMCTIGGNLAQDVRCWYYRYPNQLGGSITCLRKGGKLCNALSGDNRYHSIFGGAALVQYPCSSLCPAHPDIPSYLSNVKQGDLMAAARTLVARNPLPAITGRVCPIFCEPECNRNAFDEPVAIRCVERNLGDYILENKEEFFAPPDAESGKRVAIIGSGPAGLAAAYYLRRSGHQIIIYERLPQAGGMLRYAIPPYRLPKDVVERQIQALEAMGIIFQRGVPVGSDGMNVSDLMEQFDAVFTAGGAWKERAMGIKGEHLALSGLAFLKRVNAGDTKVPGKNVAVIGGGNVAMDVARTLLRLGAKPVVLYRRTQKKMPAFRDEFQKAREEGIRFQFLTVPTKASEAGGKVALECVHMKLGPPDASGRPQPIPKPGSEFTTTFDAVIKAIGETPDTSLLPVQFRKKRAPSSGLVSRNLFAGGDFISGPSTVIQAVAAGRETAGLIESFFLGDQIPVQKDMSNKNCADSTFDPRSRIRALEVPASERTKSIHIEDAPGVSAEDAQNEARRCFSCGCVAVNPSDVGIALIALDARIITTKRTVDAQSFFGSKAATSTLLNPDELITEIQIPKPPEGSRQAYLKFTLRKPVDFAIASVAAVFTDKDGICENARIVLGGVAPEPVRALKAEEVIKDGPIDENRAIRAAEQALSAARPLGKNEYKIEIAKTLVKRAILS